MRSALLISPCLVTLIKEKYEGQIVTFESSAKGIFIVADINVFLALSQWLRKTF